MNVYIVLRDTGEYSDYQRDILSAWQLEANAKKEIDRLKERDIKLNKNNTEFMAEVDKHRTEGSGLLKFPPENVYRELIAKYGGYPSRSDGTYIVQIVQVDTQVD